MAVGAPAPAGPAAPIPLDPGDVGIDPRSAVPADFRQRATLGVALIALVLLLPFAAASLVHRQWALSAGTFGILLLLGANALCVLRGRRHQEITLYLLVPGGMAFMTQLIVAQPMVGVVWCYPSVLASYCMLDQRRAWAANAAVLAAALPAAWLAIEPALAARVTATLLAVSAFAAILVGVIDDQQARLRRQVVTDALTGLHNRLPLAAALEEQVRARRERGAPAALLALDLDHFKRVNDLGGHEAGDAVLRAVGALLRDGLDPPARAFRLGGEEFLVLLPDTEPADALAEADGLRAAFRAAPPLARHGVTVSVGVAALGADEDRGAWLRRADERLYVAKRAGRDRVATDAEPDAHGGGSAAARAPLPA